MFSVIGVDRSLGWYDHADAGPCRLCRKRFGRLRYDDGGLPLALVARVDLFCALVYGRQTVADC
ncbi:hypothetical protein OAQ34_11750 [Opitutales bacterium]|nr:hypothetical protein [Opitutales bacterium]